MNWILDMDVRGFFDNVSHEWLVRFVEHRIADRRMIRLIQKWLKAGVSEEGEWTETKVGTPQGAVASPLLANVYLHYVFDQWVNQWRRKWAKGDMIVVRYADDAVLGFEHRKEAEAFLEQLRERMRKFGLELHPEKTRLMEFGRFAEDNRKRRGEGKPETFDFLGFTHICGKTRKGGWFTVKRSGYAANCKQSGRNCASAGMSGSPTLGNGCDRWCRATLTIMRYRGTLRHSRRFGGRWRGLGWRRSGVAARGIAYRGSVSSRSLTVFYPNRASCIRTPACGLTPSTRGRSRMR